MSKAKGGKGETEGWQTETEGQTGRYTYRSARFSSVQRSVHACMGGVFVLIGSSFKFRVES